MTPEMTAARRCRGPDAFYTPPMSDITVIRPHHLSPKKARLAAEHVAADLKSQYGLDYRWDGDGVLSFKRPGLSGQLTLARKQVTVEVRLGLLLSPLKASFEREIQDFFDQRFSVHG